MYEGLEEGQSDKHSTTGFLDGAACDHLFRMRIRTRSIIALYALYKRS